MRIPDLDSWHRRVTGTDDLDSQASNPSGLEEDVDRLVTRLEELLLAFGEKAATLQLPAAFHARKTVAVAAAKDLQSAIAKLVECENRRQAAVGQSEVLEANATVLKAGVAVGDAESKSRSAYRGLAQDCLKAEFAPAPLEGLYSEIKRLQAV
jgi:hypothetical protein